MRLKRESYLAKIRPFYEVDLIKVLTGVRRSGKSIILESIMDEIRGNGVGKDHIIFFNLEDLDYAYIDSAAVLHEEVKRRITDNGKYYVFLDEIQHVREFEKALASFRSSLNVSLFVTGSNSTLLSGELASLLTGRAVEFTILPFSYREVVDYRKLKGQDTPDDVFLDYLKWGGFPLRFELSDEISVRHYLETLYRSIVNRDILQNSKIDPGVFMDISLYILANSGKEFSADNIASYYNEKNKKKTLSASTVYNYLEKLESAFLIQPIRKYLLVGKRALEKTEKFYAVDTGFRTINTNTVNFEDTFFLENIVFNELLFQGFTVFSGKTYKGDLDFVAVRDGKKCFIQVTYLLASEQTIEREFGAFSPIRDASPKYVLSLDKIDMSHDGITHLNIIDFLLHKVQLFLS